MALTFAFFTDAALTTPATAALPFVQSVASPAAVDRILWLGSRRPDRVARLASSPGSPILLTPTGPGAANVRLALSAAGLDSATPGAALAVGNELAGGLAQAIAIHIRALDTSHTVGARDFAVSLNLAEYAT